MNLFKITFNALTEATSNEYSLSYDIAANVHEYACWYYAGLPFHIASLRRPEPEVDKHMPEKEINVRKTNTNLIKKWNLCLL